MYFHNFLLMAATVAIPMALAEIAPERLQVRSVSTVHDVQAVEESLKEVIARSADGDVNEIITNLAKAGFGDLLDRADNEGVGELLVRADSDPGLAQNLWVAVPAACVSILLYL